MMLSAGEHEIGPRNGRLILRTFREGMAAVVGHDLVIEVTRWQGTITVPGGPDRQPRLAVEVDLRSLQVREGHGGAKPLTDNDRREIEKTIAKSLKAGEHPQASFASTTVQVDDDKATVDGELTLLGVTQPLRLTAQVADDRTVIGKASVQQSRWGIRPYRGFMGALKVRDAVEVQGTVALADELTLRR
jgi:polyisoprenoid-binding protein YceI